MKKKYFSWVLVCVLCLTLLPTAVRAENWVRVPGNSQELQATAAVLEEKAFLLADGTSVTVLMYPANTTFQSNWVHEITRADQEAETMTAFSFVLPAKGVYVMTPKNTAASSTYVSAERALFEEPAVAPTPSAPQVSVDEPSGWAMEAVQAATAAGIVPDSLQSRYRKAASRADFCALATALYEDLKGEITERATFTDTTDVNVEKMAALGVVAGVGEGKFAPDSLLTREQAAAMLTRLSEALGYPLSVGTPTFADRAAISKWAYDAVGTIQKHGIMNGIGENRFAPTMSYTREQAILTMYKVYNMYERYEAMKPAV